MSYLNELKTPFFILAPMDDVTDTVFRRVVSVCAKPDIFFTEFTNVDGLQSPGRSKLIRKLQFTKEERPLVAQLWGKNPENFYKTAKQIADGSLAKELGLAKNINFAGVDLNMGCPQKKEVNGGTCAALINDRPLAKQIIEATQKGLNGELPLSVKTRTGYNEVDLTWIEFLLKQNLNMLTVHGRTKKDKSKVPADWKVIGKARELRDQISPSTLIVGNGDVLNREQGMELAKKYKLDGIMIGRGIFNDPFIFSKDSPWQDKTKDEKVELFKQHVKLFAETWSENGRPVQTINKFCKIYINGFDGAQQIRERLMQVNGTQELLDLLSDID